MQTRISRRKKHGKYHKTRAILFLLFVFLMMSGVKIVRLSEEETVRRVEVQIVSHIVAERETIWRIADRYNRDMDKRQYVQKIVELNGGSDAIGLGEVIAIPVYR